MKSKNKKLSVVVLGKEVTVKKYQVTIQVDETELCRMYPQEKETPLEEVVEIEFGWLAGIQLDEMEEGDE